jgi:hypothetical protein
MAIKMVALRNGSQEAEGLVSVIMWSIRKLVTGGGLQELLMVHDLRSFALDGTQPFYGDELAKLKLVDKTPSGFSIHQSVANVANSAIELNGDCVRVVSPVAD